MKKRLMAAGWIMLILLAGSCRKKEPVLYVVDFEDLPLTASGYWNGSDGSGGFTSGNLSFQNKFDPQTRKWAGFAYTNHADTVTKDETNIYSSITATGADESLKFGVYSYRGSPDTIFFDVPGKVSRIVFANTVHTYYSILNGSPTCKKFGGATGNDQDWFKVTLTAISPDDTEIGYVDIYMADYRFMDNSRDYIANAWTDLDLSVFGFISALKIELSSSDSGPGGMNTPPFICIDGIVFELEPSDD